MTEKEDIKRSLEKQLEEVKQRLQILDLTEERLLEMRKIAQSRIDGELTDEEIQQANSQLARLFGLTPK